MGMTVLAIDPGSEQSAWVLWDGTLLNHAKEANADVLQRFCEWIWTADGSIIYGPMHIAIEWVASYGMPVGAEVFDTARWVGRFEQAAPGCGDDVTLVVRRDVKLHLCGNARAKDSNIRQALIDRFGGKEKAIGRKAAPGPLYGLRADEWSALALAITFMETHACKSDGGKRSA